MSELWREVEGRAECGKRSVIENLRILIIFNGYQVGVTITVQNSFIQNEHSSFYLCMSWKSFVPYMFLTVPKCQ